MTKRGGQGKRGKALALAGVLALTALFLFLTATSSGPAVPPRAAPTAQDVGAGRVAYRQLRGARGNKAGAPVRLTQRELTGLGAVASHGFRPDRLMLSIQGVQLIVQASHHLPLGRWLNVTLRAEGPSSNFPRTRLKVGIWDLPPWLSRWTLQVGRLILSRRVEVPPLDLMVRNFAVRQGTVSAMISLPGRAGLVDRMAGAVSQSVDSDQVIRIYCGLANRQRKQPSADFAEQVRRAFSIDPGSANQPDFNRAAFVALGMLLVDQRVGDFAGISDSDLGRCRMPVLPVSIYGRQDWPKHWTLSAAIAVGAGTQLSEAAGEWKELADSLARQSEFAVGDPSGFSMVDLTADRAGFRTAQAAWHEESASRVAAALAKVSAEQLLPRELTLSEDSLTNAAFVQRYGGVDDPRFKARVSEIDAAVDKTGLR